MLRKTYTGSTWDAGASGGGFWFAAAASGDHPWKIQAVGRLIIPFNTDRNSHSAAYAKRSHAPTKTKTIQIVDQSDEDTTT